MFSSFAEPGALEHDRHRLLGADHRDRDDRHAGTHRDLDEPAAAEPAELVAVAVELARSLRALGEHEHELLSSWSSRYALSGCAATPPTRDQSVPTHGNRAEAGSRRARRPDAASSVSMPCMIDGASERDRAGVVGDEQRAAFARDVLEGLPTRRGTSAGRSGRRPCGRPRAGARCGPTRRRLPAAPASRRRLRVAAPARGPCSAAAPRRGGRRAPADRPSALAGPTGLTSREGNRVEADGANRPVSGGSHRARDRHRDPTYRAAMPTHRAPIQSTSAPQSHSSPPPNTSTAAAAGANTPRVATSIATARYVTSPAPIRMPSRTNTTALSGCIAATIRSTARASACTAESAVNSGTTPGAGPRAGTPNTTPTATPHSSMRRARGARLPALSRRGSGRPSPARRSRWRRARGRGTGTPGTRSGARRRRRRRCATRSRWRQGTRPATNRCGPRAGLRRRPTPGSPPRCGRADACSRRTLRATITTYASAAPHCAMTVPHAEPAIPRSRP